MVNQGYELIHCKHDLRKGKEVIVYIDLCDIAFFEHCQFIDITVTFLLPDVKSTDQPVLIVLAKGSGKVWELAL